MLHEATYLLQDSSHQIRAMARRRCSRGLAIIGLSPFYTLPWIIHFCWDWSVNSNPTNYIKLCTMISTDTPVSTDPCSLSNVICRVWSNGQIPSNIVRLDGVTTLLAFADQAHPGCSSCVRWKLWHIFPFLSYSWKPYTKKFAPGSIYPGYAWLYPMEECKGILQR